MPMSNCHFFVSNCITDYTFLKWQETVCSSFGKQYCLHWIHFFIKGQQMPERSNLRERAQSTMVGNEWYQDCSSHGTDMEHILVDQEPSQLFVVNNKIIKAPTHHWHHLHVASGGIPLQSARLRLLSGPELSECLHRTHQVPSFHPKLPLATPWAL